MRFAKMQALGNDFVMLDGVTEGLKIGPGIARRIADRRRGIGCDQVLLLERAQGGADFRYRIWNSDGGEVAQCGNGARCALVFAESRGLLKGRAEGDLPSAVLETSAGTIRVEGRPGGRVRAHLGRPVFAPERIPTKIGEWELLQVVRDGFPWVCQALSLGNPHAVFILGEECPDEEELHLVDIADLAGALRRKRKFPEGVNVGVCWPEPDGGPVHLRVDERGVGETPACGSGAAAAAVALARNGIRELPVVVSLVGGELEAGWEGGDSPAWIEGEASEVFTGEFDMEGIG